MGHIECMGSEDLPVKATGAELPGHMAALYRALPCLLRMNGCSQCHPLLSVSAEIGSEGSLSGVLWLVLPVCEI